MSGMLTVWSLDDQHPTSRVAAHDARIWSIAASADQRLLATVGADHRVAVWDVRNLRLLQEVRMDNIPTACHFFGESNTVIVGDRSGQVTFIESTADGIDGDNSAAAATASVESDRCRIVAFVDESPDGSLSQYSQRLIWAMDRTELPYVIRRIAGLPLLSTKFRNYTNVYCD